MRIKVTHSLGDLADDFESMPPRLLREGRKIVKRNLREGRTLARASARRNSPRHGQHYDDAITDEMTGPMAGEYGPDPSLTQGGMLFEEGEGRQSRPHRNLAKSFDVVAPKFRADARDLLKDLFW